MMIFGTYKISQCRDYITEEKIYLQSDPLPNPKATGPATITFWAPEEWCAKSSKYSILVIPHSAEFSFSDISGYTCFGRVEFPDIAEDLATEEPAMAWIFFKKLENVEPKYFSNVLGMWQPAELSNVYEQPQPSLYNFD